MCAGKKDKDKDNKVVPAEAPTKAPPTHKSVEGGEKFMTEADKENATFCASTMVLLQVRACEPRKGKSLNSNYVASLVADC